MALLPFAIIIGGNILTSILVRILIMVSPGLASIASLLGSLVALAGAVLLILNTIKMVNEVKAVTRNDGFAWWPILIPIYSIYWVLILLPQEVTKAKQMLGVQKPTQSMVLYFFLFPYALAVDINDMVR